jgi:hypothetical protein
MGRPISPRPCGSAWSSQQSGPCAHTATRFCQWAPGELRGDTGQDEAEWGSPVSSGNGEAATDDGAEGPIGVGQAPVTGDVNGEFPQLQEGEGKVRDHPAEKKKQVGASSPWRVNRRRRWVKMWQGAAVARPPVWMGDRGQERGVCSCGRGEKEWGERKGVVGGGGGRFNPTRGGGVQADGVASRGRRSGGEAWGAAWRSGGVIGRQRLEAGGSDAVRTGQRWLIGGPRL